MILLLMVGDCTLFVQIVSEDAFSSTFASLLLTLTALRPRVMSLHTFEFWIAFEDSTPQSRHAYYQQEVFHSLTIVMLGQLLHPGVTDGDGGTSMSGWGGNDDSDDDLDEDEETNDLIEFRKDDQVFDVVDRASITLQMYFQFLVA